MKIPALLLLTTFVAFAEENLLSNADLSNWSFESTEGAEAAENSWKLQNGVLSTSGKPIGFIRTKSSYENYSLTLEWRWLPGTEKGNSGLLLHVSTPNAAGPWPKSVESQLEIGNAGDIWMIGEKLEASGKNEKGRWIRTADPAEKDPGEWNTMTVTCKGDTLTIAVNGTTVNEATKLTATKGAIGLQSEGFPIEFRNIVLTEAD